MIKTSDPVETRGPYLIEAGLTKNSEVVSEAMMGGISHRPEGC